MFEHDPMPRAVKVFTVALGLSVATFPLLAACAGEPTPTGETVTTRDTADNSIDVLDVPLPDGRTVTCVRFHDGNATGQAGGLSCDWRKATR